MSLADPYRNDNTWKILYYLGSAAAVFGVLMIPVQLGVFIATPPPDTAAGWFTLFQSNKLAGLLAFEFLFVVNAVFGVATILSLYAALRRINESLMAVALVLGLLEAFCFVVARPGVEMLFLSDKYAAATTDAQRALYLAAGETLWATFHGTAFHVGYNLFSIYFLLVSTVMLQSGRFGKVVPLIGIVAAILNWGLYVPGLGLILSALSVLPLAIWDIVIAWKLVQLAQERGVAHFPPDADSTHQPELIVASSN